MLNAAASFKGIQTGSLNSHKVANLEVNNCLITSICGQNCNASKMRKMIIKELPATVVSTLDKCDALQINLYLHYLVFNYDLQLTPNQTKQLEQTVQLPARECQEIIKIIVKLVQEKIQQGSRLDVNFAGQVLANQTGKNIQVYFALGKYEGKFAIYPNHSSISALTNKANIVTREIHIKLKDEHFTQIDRPPVACISLEPIDYINAVLNHKVETFNWTLFLKPQNF